MEQDLAFEKQEVEITSIIDRPDNVLQLPLITSGAQTLGNEAVMSSKRDLKLLEDNNPRQYINMNPRFNETADRNRIKMIGPSNIIHLTSQTIGRGSTKHS